MRGAFERVFADPVPAQHKGLQQVLRDFPADVIIADDTMLGVLPMLFGPRAKRPAIVLARPPSRRPPLCSLRHIDLALAPCRRSAAFCRLAARNHSGTARGIR